MASRYAFLVPSWCLGGASVVPSWCLAVRIPGGMQDARDAKKPGRTGPGKVNGDHNLRDSGYLLPGAFVESTVITRRTPRRSAERNSRTGVSTTCFAPDEAWIIMPSPT